jgi:NADH-quinone oxidoreductase subunit E
LSPAPRIEQEPAGEMAPDADSFAFTPENERLARAFIARYPEGRQQSAIMPLLHLAQKQHGGWLPRACLDYVADFLGLPRMRAYEVASFYDMYNIKPTGRVQVRVCTTTPCWLCGSDEVLRACHEVLGIETNESSADGRYFLREFECLGACANAPILWIDDEFYEDLDYEKTRALLEALKRGEQLKPGSQTGRTASMPAGGKTTLRESPLREPAQPQQAE